MDRDGLAVMPESGPLARPEASTTAKAGGSFRALRSGPFRLYFGGQVVSASGTFLQQTAIGWLVLERIEPTLAPWAHSSGRPPANVTWPSTSC